ncbi:MAG: hypothetical protein ACOCZB_08825, partial [Spirochaetota bacterium]
TDRRRSGPPAFALSAGIQLGDHDLHVSFPSVSKNRERTLALTPQSMRTILMPIRSRGLG